MKQILLKTWLIVVCLLVLGGGRIWAQSTTLFHETFGDNSGSARNWSDTYSVKSGVAAVYSGITGYTISNAKQGKNTTGSTKSGLNQTTSGTDAYIIIGPLNVFNYSNISLKYQWKAASTKETYTTKAYYATSSTGSFTEITGGTGNGATTFVERSYSVPEAAQVSTLYLKIVWNTSNTQAIIDEVDLSGVAGGGSTATPLSVPTNLSSSNVTSTGATLSWDAVANASSYKVKIGSTEYDTNTNSYSATGLTASTKYTWSVKAIGDGTSYSSSDYAANANFTTTAPPSHKAYFYVNCALQNAGGTDFTEGASITFPVDPSEDGVTFVGWTKTSDYSNATDAPSDLCKAATMGTEDVTYYAVFATVTGEGPEVVNYVKLTSNSFDTSKKYAIGAEQDNTTTAYFTSYSEVDKNASWGIMSTNTIENTPLVFTLSGTANELVAKDNNGNYLNGTVNDFRMQSTSVTNILNADGTIHATQASNNTDRNLRYNTSYGLRWYSTTTGNPAYFYEIQVSGGFEYSDYCTTVSLDSKPTIVLSATELAEYAGNTNTSITASVSEGAYTGALTVESSADAVATASISEGTITINALTAGSATITVTAPAVTGFRKATATIAVTVSEKFAHGLSFSADALNLTVGDTEFSEPTLSNPNSLPVVYSLVYATPANEGKVATIAPATGKLTLADPSLSTETQGAVTVKATTVGDDSHAAGEVTYNLVVARKVTTTSWSNEGAAVNIDKDEIATLPIATNSGERNLFYESSNPSVATIDNTGAVTFVAYGSTTIIAKTTATSEYAATSASYKLTFAPRYTVTFDAQAGTCGEVSLREARIGEGVMLPAATCLDSEWSFAGWATAASEETTTAPTLYKAGTTYKPTSDVTLYAVYMAGATEGEIAFNRVTDISELTDGKRVVVVSNATNYALTLAAGDTNQYTNSTTISMSDNGKIWTLTKTESEYVFRNNASTPKTMSTSGVPKTTTINISSIGNLGSSNNAYKYGNWTIAPSTISDCFTITNTRTTDNGTAALTVGTVSGKTQWGVLNVNDSNGSRDASVFAMRIYVEGPTTTATYNSNPISTAIITLNAACHTDEGEVYGTYSSSSAFVVPATLCVEEVSVNDGKLQVESYETGDIVPANTGVMIHAAEGGEYKVYLSKEEGTSVLGANNCLHPSSEPMTGDNLFYRLTMHNGSQIGFWWGAADGAAFTLSANKAYLAVPKSAASAIRSGAWFGDEGTLTTIEGVAAEINAENVIFNLSGQRVTRAEKGVYIINGRKVIR